MTKPYRPRRPRWREYHRPWRTAFIANSSAGPELAFEDGCSKIDNDLQLTLDGVVVRAHGAPETFWLPKGGRFERHTWAELHELVRHHDGHPYHLTTATTGMHECAAAGVGMSGEVKDWLQHPLAPERHWAHDPAFTVFHDLATDAADAWGEHWRRHFVIKVSTSLPGGLGYALEICEAAHAATIPTMILARGRDRFRTFEGHREITYVRGSVVIR